MPIGTPIATPPGSQACSLYAQGIAHRWLRSPGPTDDLHAFGPDAGWCADDTRMSAGVGRPHTRFLDGHPVCDHGEPATQSNPWLARRRR